MTILLVLLFVLHQGQVEHVSLFTLSHAREILCHIASLSRHSLLQYLSSWVTPVCSSQPSSPSQWVILILPPTSLSLVRPLGSHCGWVKLQPLYYVYILCIFYVGRVCWDCTHMYIQDFYYICDFG